MTFNPRNFRRIPEEGEPPPKIRTTDNSTLILIQSTGDAEYARTRGDKDQLVQRFNATADLLLWAWVGQHHTDIFILTQADLNRYYR